MRSRLDALVRAQWGRLFLARPPERHFESYVWDWDEVMVPRTPRVGLVVRALCDALRRTRAPGPTPGAPGLAGGRVRRG